MAIANALVLEDKSNGYVVLKHYGTTILEFNRFKAEICYLYAKGRTDARYINTLINHIYPKRFVVKCSLVNGTFRIIETKDGTITRYWYKENNRLDITNPIAKTLKSYLD